MNYPVGDFLIRIKNAYMAGKKEVVTPSSKNILAISKILEEEGYIKKTKEKKEERKIVVELSYSGRIPALSDVKLVSKPSVHEYFGKRKLMRATRAHGISVVTTNKGIMTSKKAHMMGVGGELICHIS